MLRHSFVHMKGVGPLTEEKWWAQDITNWEELADSGQADSRQQASLDESILRLDQRDAVWFEQGLDKASENWRLYADFLEDAAFLDIETTGLIPGYHRTTVVGVLDSSGYHAFVRDDNLGELPSVLRKYKLIITYNGRQFDLPFLAAEFAELPSGFAHIDLRWLFVRLKHRAIHSEDQLPSFYRGFYARLKKPGGLKQLEQSFGWGRQGMLASLDGRHAGWLWDMAQEGNNDARDTLIRYNAEDVASLPKLALLAVELLRQPTPMWLVSMPSFPEFDCAGLPFDNSVIEKVLELEAAE